MESKVEASDQRPAVRQFVRSATCCSNFLHQTKSYQTRRRASASSTKLIMNSEHLKAVAQVVSFKNKQAPTTTDESMDQVLKFNNKNNCRSSRVNASAAAAAISKSSIKRIDSSISTIEEEEEEDEDRNVDGGYAWVVLAVIFTINASTFGTARAYGLIFDKLARDDSSASRTSAAMPFTLMGAIENMAGPLSGYLLDLTRNCTWQVNVFTGSCLVAAAHLLAALFTESTPTQMACLLLVMGLACGLGLSLVSLNFFHLNNAYFARYRSTAFGIGMTGAALGTLYISPLCQYTLDTYGVSACYVMLGLILLPNVPLSLLLKPKWPQFSDNESELSSSSSTIDTISGELQERTKENNNSNSNNNNNNQSIWTSVKMVFKNPMFHLIWPTQLLFCWFNFVFGMIIVDFGRDRNLSPADCTQLVPCWAIGQLVGRLCLSSLVDLKFLTYKTFTVITFFAISLTTFLLNYTRVPNYEDPTTTTTSQLSSQDAGTYANLLILLLVFILSMFIALLYILFNGLVVTYVETHLQPLSFGISSFTGSFFLLPRANIIGYYRDTIGNYDDMLTMFTYVSLCAALIWLLLPVICASIKQVYLSRRAPRLSFICSTLTDKRLHTRAMENVRAYSQWRLASTKRSIRATTSLKYPQRARDPHVRRHHATVHRVESNPNVFVS